ncbi:MAG: transglycosylase SLT domain-containing protein, partial [Bdellovibrionales bacterium]|nr:transglycosylase SLT domain-containing protein [Bdellovibrionales bacterium]
HFLRLEKYKPETRLQGEERQAWRRFYKANDKGQTIKVVRGGVDFLTKYPGSTKAKEVSRRITTFFKRLLYRRGVKFQSQKEAFVGYMKKAPAQYLYQWGDVAYQRGYYAASAPLATSAAEKWEGRPEAAKALILAARSQYNQSQWSEAKALVEQLIEKHSGHEAFGEAQYLLGLMYYRQQKWSDVVATYDRFLLNDSSDKWELQVRYWLWRAMKKLESARADKVAEVILREFPLSYYGLQVRMETKGSLQSLLQGEKSDIKSSYWWTVSAEKRWERIKKLLVNGWLDEAEREMDLLPDPQLAEGFVVRAQVWKSAFRTRRAMQDYSDAVDKDPTFLTPSLIKMSFPQEYKSSVDKAQKEFSVSQDMIWAIMRQESAFNARAVSPSKAYGLMQLLKPTMKETAKWLKVKKFNFQRDRFKADSNVRFGTHFLSRMIRKYKGVVPLAIASYNVGPGNLDRWIKQRSDLSNWAEYNGNPDNEMWMDELPWAETSFYVKAVMRNFLLYRIIHGQYDKLESPAWSGAQDFYQVPKDI